MTNPAPSVAFESAEVTLHHGDCLDVLAGLPDCSVDSVVTDPPYGLANTDPAHVAETITRWVNGERDYLPGGAGFMGKSWDAFVPPVAVWDECLRVLKPGGHVLAFAGSRTVDLMTLGLRLAGFDIRDSIAWLYGSGFPKSMDVSKAIDKMRDDREPVDAVRAWLNARRLEARVTHDTINKHFGHASNGGGSSSAWMTNPTSRALPTWEQWRELKSLLRFGDEMDAEVMRLNDRKGEPGEAYAQRPDADYASGVGMAESWTAGKGWNGKTAKGGAGVRPEAQEWQGWGTALKPAFEPVVVARKPLVSPGVNVLERVESELRNRGVEGAIEWTSRPASGAAKPARQISSSSTEAQPTAGASAAPVDASGTESAEKPTGSDSATSTPHGAKPTGSTSAPTPDARPLNSEPTCSPPTATPAPAVGSEPPTSSPSITSREAAPPTARRRGARSTTKSSDSTSPTVIESFAGIATGLSGSWATVRIDRLAGGTFAWPDGLPRNTAGGSTVAANVLAWGTGALNIDASRIGTSKDVPASASAPQAGNAVGIGSVTALAERSGMDPNVGRFPANVILDESQAAALDAQSGVLDSGGPARRASGHYDRGGGESWLGTRTADGGITAYPGAGGASRFFYTAKADSAERPVVDGIAHPTVKPLDLMRYLVRLVTPKGGVVLEPFAGSGTTLEAAVLEGFRAIGIEREADYIPLIMKRLDKPHEVGFDLFGDVA